jgi:Tfp pilus assembly protein PilV
MPRLRNAGFAMLDVLVALLLLAMVLTGTCVTLIHTMRATGAALLASRAVDLAADFTAELRGATSGTQADTMLVAWRSRIAALLPVSGMEPEDLASLAPAPPAAAGETQAAIRSYQLTLRWRVAPEEIRELKLPVAATFMNAPP